MSVPTRCRMCLTECDDGELKSMLTVSSDSINLWTMYDYIMNVEESVDSTFEPYICIKCKEDLKTAYSFKLMCSETERTLNELAKNGQGENEYEIEYIYDDEFKLEEDADYVEISEDNCTADNVETVIAEVDDDLCKSDDENAVEEFDSERMKPDVINRKNSVEGLGNERMQPDVINRKCRVCDIWFKNMKEYQTHYRQLHRRMYRRKINNNYEIGRNCTACNIYFETLKEYQVHYRRLHARKKKTDPLSKTLCSHCGKLFGKTFLWKHIQSKHSGVQKNHTCKVCGKSFTFIENLIMHTRIHNNDKR